MCKKCLYPSDHDHGVEFAPVHAGTGMRPGVSKRPYSPYGYDKQPNYNKIRFGDNDNLMPGWKRRPSYSKDDRIEFDPDKTDYTARELEQLADQFLRDDARSIARCECSCDDCEAGDHCGEVICEETSKERGIGGKDPILFAEHLYQRQKREILNENGVPEPSLVNGIYNRSHPEGRKINSEEQRRKNGASYFR